MSDTAQPQSNNPSHDPPDKPKSQTQSEVELTRLAQSGPFKPNAKRFEEVLTVPLALQMALFRWQSELDLCDRAALVGQALDFVTGVYTSLLMQFAKTSEVRTRFLHAPTEYMVTSMYYCDRALDGIMHGIAETRKKILRLYEELGETREKCVSNRNAAEKTYREVEMDALPDLKDFVEQRKAKACVFGEFAQRIDSVLKGGDGMFRFYGKKWCEESALCRKLLQEHEDRGQVGGQVQMEGTPEDDEGVQSNGVPETPETVRAVDVDAPITQVSSPRKRSLSARKRAREMRGVVARSLIGLRDGESVKSLQMLGDVRRDEDGEGDEVEQQSKKRRVEGDNGDGREEGQSVANGVEKDV